MENGSAPNEKHTVIEIEIFPINETFPINERQSYLAAGTAGADALKPGHDLRAQVRGRNGHVDGMGLLDED